MTLSEAALAIVGGADPESIERYQEARRRLGRAVAAALLNRDSAALERACQIAGTYSALVDAAIRAGVDRDELEEALGAI